MDEWRPRIVGFLCNWCSYAGADHAGGLKLPYPADVRLVRVMCSGRVDPQFVLTAFRGGADGVMVLGCHPGDCHYRDGNLKALRRTRMLTALLPQLGVDPERLLLDWVAAGEGEKFHRLVSEMAERIARLGPLSLTGCVAEEAV
ncbi:MAG: hydrogenase iron-sulfur subunit [Planctomycetota bacterium]|jgi:F420-non-reducing hydrogenase iron-sulfur subunit